MAREMTNSKRFKNCKYEKNHRSKNIYVFFYNDKGEYTSMVSLWCGQTENSVSQHPEDEKIVSVRTMMPYKEVAKMIC